MSAPALPTIDAVIVTFDTREMTLACVEDLRGAPIGRVIVVDNASTDGTVEALAARAPEAEVVRLEEGVGFARACNLGAARGRGELVLFLNSDILLTPGAVETLARELLARPQAVVAGGRLVDPGTLETQAAYRPRTFPSAATLAVQLLGVEERWPANPVTRRHHGAQVRDDAGTVAVEQP